MMNEAGKAQQSDVDAVNAFLRQWMGKRKTSVPELARRICDSMSYSLDSGGKRFRPLLTLQTGRLLGVEQDKLLPFAAAVEMIHTYSLIHDDLPCMDNDDIRRGQPTNHRKFDEPTALLAGDALLTESFLVLAEGYRSEPDVALRLVEKLSLAAGLSGMIAGQQIDMVAQKAKISEEDLFTQHRLKTGALIAVSVAGAGLVARTDSKIQTALENYGAMLGLAFQIADDLLDHAEGEAEASGLPGLIGEKRCREELRKASASAKGALESFGDKASELLRLIDYNESRLK